MFCGNEFRKIKVGEESYISEIVSYEKTTQLNHYSKHFRYYGYGILVISILCF
ncbi:MAG: hypothetical protein ACJATI_001748 [Halioglobus sp.]|jgi:hypothetical protein